MAVGIVRCDHAVPFMLIDARVKHGALLELQSVELSFDSMLLLGGTSWEYQSHAVVLIALVSLARLSPPIAYDHPIDAGGEEILQPLCLGAFLDGHVHGAAHPPLDVRIPNCRRVVLAPEPSVA